MMQVEGFSAKVNLADEKEAFKNLCLQRGVVVFFTQHGFIAKKEKKVVRGASGASYSLRFYSVCGEYIKHKSSGKIVDTLAR